MARGFLYLGRHIDVYSRYLISLRLSNTLDADSVWRHGRGPQERSARDIPIPIKGYSLPARRFTGALTEYGVRESARDGKGSYQWTIFYRETMAVSLNMRRYI